MANTRSSENLPNANVIVREAQTDDVMRIAEIHQTMGLELAKLAPAGFGESMQNQPSLDEITVEFNEALADEDATLLVVELAGEVSGFLLLVIERFDDDLVSAPFATIQYIATDNTVRGKGLGRKLVVEAESRAAALGVSTIDLLVWNGNDAAIRLYDKLGYQSIEQRMAKRIDY